MFKRSAGVGVTRAMGRAAVVLLIGSGAGFGTGVASADIVVITPEPNVSSEQADSVSKNSTQGKIRGAKPNTVHAHGEVRDSVKATPNRKHRADPWVFSPPMGLGQW